MFSRTMLSLAVSSALVAGVLSLASAPAQAEPESTDPIKLTLHDWTGQLITTNLMAEILKKGGYNVELVVDTPIEVVQRHLGPWATATTLGANTTRIEMSVPDLGWAVLMLAVLNADIRQQAPDVPLDLARLIDRATAFDPGRRPQTSLEMVNELARVIEHLQASRAKRS